MTHRELGAKILKKLTGDLVDVAEVEVAPKMEGYQMFTIFIPKKTLVDSKKKASTKAAQPAAEKENKEPAKAKPEPAKAEPAAPEAAKPEPKDDDEIF
jgi:translation initiation factor IF-3